MQIYDGRDKPLSQWHWSIPLVLCTVALIVMLLGEGVAELLRYQRASIVDGAFWRLFSGHLVHLGWAHLWLNLVGLWLIWVIAGDALSVIGWWLLLLLCALFTSLGLLLFNPELQWYVGLSGILHGLMLAGLVTRLVVDRRPDVLLLLVVLVAKLAWEQYYGPLPGSEASVGATVVVDAHLYGAIAGAAGVTLFLVVPAWRRRFVK